MRRRQRLWIILLVAPLVLVAAHTVYWRMTERSLGDGFAAWLAERSGGRLDRIHTPPVAGGWPLDATLTVPDVELKGGAPDLPGGLTWNAERLVLRVGLLRPTLLDVAAEGTQHTRVAGGPELRYTADRMHLALPLQADAPQTTVDFSVRNLHSTMPAAGDTGAGMAVGQVRIHLDLRQATQSDQPTLAFSLHAEGINPPAGVARPLGPRIASLAFDGALNGPVPQAGGLADRAAAWRDGGGSLEIQHFALNWDRWTWTASATLSLDEQLPMGAGSARAVGYAEILDALQRMPRSAGPPPPPRRLCCRCWRIARTMAVRRMSRCPDAAIPHAVHASGAAGPPAGGRLAVAAAATGLAAIGRPIRWLGASVDLTSNTRQVDLTRLPRP